MFVDPALDVVLDWITKHMQLIGWPTMVLIAWRASKAFANKEHELMEEKAKLDETHAVAKETKETLVDMLREFKRSNDHMDKLVGEMVRLREDFHEHTVEDKAVQGNIHSRLEEIQENTKDILANSYKTVARHS